MKAFDKCMILYLATIAAAYLSKDNSIDAIKSYEDLF